MATANWTDGRLKTFIVGVLRGGYRRYPPKHECLQDAFVGKHLNEKTNRVGNHYRCASCNGIFPTKDVNVDHITPVVDPHVGFVSWDSFITNLFCDKDNLQVLCSSCHDVKTKEENNKRKTTRANSKSSKKT